MSGVEEKGSIVHGFIATDVVLNNRKGFIDLSKDEISASFRLINDN